MGTSSVMWPVHARNQKAGLGQMEGECVKSSLINEGVALDDRELFSHERTSQIRLMLIGAWLELLLKYTAKMLWLDFLARND